MTSSKSEMAFKVPPVAGRKRPGPALLPAFEPSSLSPRLPPLRTIRHASGPPKTLAASVSGPNYLPSAPTSSTYVPTSSPPRHSSSRPSRLQRTISSISERAPLATLPAIELGRCGEAVLLGRSSSSSHHQLSTNKLISRVHVRAIFIPASETNPKQVQVECLGWNGVSVHCQGKAWDLFKGDTFTSETEDAEILVHVHDSRVLIKWPGQQQKILTPTDSEGAWESETSPLRTRSAPAAASAKQRSTGSSFEKAGLQPHSPKSPLRCKAVIDSPKVASPNVSFRGENPVLVYEDAPSDEDASDQAPQMAQGYSAAVPHAVHDALPSTSEVLGDSDEENDPIVHSFGPYGANINNRLDAINASFSPQGRRPLEPLPHERISPQRQHGGGSASKRRRLSQGTIKWRDPVQPPVVAESTLDQDQLANIAINHLMYSQLSATPLSTLLAHVETVSEAIETRQQQHAQAQPHLFQETLESLLRSVPCIGSVQREGKDAAGKSLETEYYYLPDLDEDEGRRNTVSSLGIGGRGLRNCRKSHKVSQISAP